MRFKNVEIPDWLEFELKQRSSEPDFNDLIAILLDDYIKRYDLTREVSKLSDKELCKKE